MSDDMFSQVSLIAARLGWQFQVADVPAQPIASPMDRSLHLRCSLADDPHPAIAVDLIEENGKPVVMPPGPPILLLDFCLDTDTAVRQLKAALIEPYQAMLRNQSASDAQRHA